jgi:hypothetical protein
VARQREEAARRLVAGAHRPAEGNRRLDRRQGRVRDLYDKPYENTKCVRVAGPFTVESLSPHRMLGVDEDDELIDGFQEDRAEYSARQSFPQLILENLKTAGVQQAHKEDRITFTALTPWPGEGDLRRRTLSRRPGR